MSFDPVYCPRCGEQAWETRIPRKDDKPRQCCTACGYVHYTGPTLAAGIILRDADRYLLVRRAHDPGRGKWSFPGGFVDLDETAEAAALREAKEETGCDAEIEQLIGIYNSTGPGGKKVAIAVFLGRVTAQCDVNSEEVAAIRWFDVADIPWDEFAFEATANVLRGFVEGRT